MHHPICPRHTLEHKLRCGCTAPLTAIIRYRLTLAVIALFAIIALAALVMPDAPMLRYLLPFAASLLVMALRPYFGPPDSA
jgi:hypothetical protein